MKRNNKTTQSNYKTLFKTQHTTNNPFYLCNERKKENSLITQMQQSNKELLINNSLFAAALKCDPHAVWGITSQIRIA